MNRAVAGHVAALPAARDAPLRYALKPLDKYLSAPGVTEVVINQPGEVVTETDRGWCHTRDEAISLQWLRDFVQLAATFNGTICNEAQPILSGVLPGGQRVQVVVPPTVDPGLVAVTIRVPAQIRRTREDYEATGFTAELPVENRELSDEEKRLPYDDRVLLELKLKGRWWDFFIESVRRKKNAIISGKTGVGKTTFVNTLIDYIPTHERIVTIEDTREITLPKHPNRVHMLAIPGVNDAVALLKSCMRMKPDRILLAELRDSTALEFISTASSGHPGTITTVHAGHCAQAIHRMARLIRQSPDAGTLTQTEIVALLKVSIDVIIQMHVRETVDPTSNEVHKTRVISEVYYDPIAARLAIG
jgi:type IV secretion system protein VirB11